MTPFQPSATTSSLPTGSGGGPRVAGGVASGGRSTGTATGRGALWVPLGGIGVVLVAVGILGVRTSVVVLGLVVAAVFCAFFVRHLGFATSALRGSDDADLPMVDTGYRPTVSVLVACHNEEAVAGCLVEGLVAIDYPSDRLEWVVVDDGSSDGTGAILDDAARSHARFTVLHRPPGSGGGKSGALNAALAVAGGEIVVVFDADHRPHPDVVLRLVRHFEDGQVAAVQGRCLVANGEDSPITAMVAVDYLAGYYVNEYGRQAMYRLPAYGGANCAVRASTLLALGGWNRETVTEDTDLTLRMVLSGWRVRYDVAAVDEEEGVVTFGRYWRQRERWARGHQQAWRDYRGAVWSSDRLTLAEKVESEMFLFAFHLPVLSLFGMGLLVAWFAGYGPPGSPLALDIYSTLLFLGPLVELGAGLLLGRADRRMAWAMVWFLPMFLVSMAICTWAWLSWAFGGSYTWVKTKRSGDPVAWRGASS